MSQALIMRDRSIAVSESEREIAQRVMTTGIRGIDEKHDKRWKRFLRTMFSMESGEIAEVSTRVARSGPFHRFHMLVEQALFKGQERFQHFEQFRNWLKVGSGFCDWVAGPRGGVIPIPKSIAYSELEESEMREFHDAMLVFLRGPHAAPYLWRHLPDGGAAEMMETILAGFDR